MAEIIAVVEDDPDIRCLISETLTGGGYVVDGFGSARDFRSYLDKQQPDLVILDLMLPDADGMEVCRSLRNDKATAAIPVIILTARDTEMDKVHGLELGADDYITKPFSIRELLARVRARLRRVEAAAPEAVLEVGGVIRIDPAAHEVTLDGTLLSLTITEFRILQILAERKGRVFSREQLLDRLWGNEKYVIDRTIDVHIKNLRDKLGEHAGLVRSIRGVGYKIDA